jgi:hypothetical protein
VSAQVIQTASGQQIIVQNVGQAGGAVQIAGGETLQQIQVPPAPKNDKNLFYV